MPARRLVTGFFRAAKPKGGFAVENRVGSGEARVFAGYAGVIIFVLH